MTVQFELVESGGPFDWGVQYVHPDGSDANTGFSPAIPKATVEAAYADLPDSGGAVCLANNQRHDLGDGLSLDKDKRVAFYGAPKGNRSVFHPNCSDGPILYSSTEAATLITFIAGSNSYAAYGFAFRDLDFEISPDTTLVFDAPNVNMMELNNCSFSHPVTDLTKTPFTVIHAYNSGGDSSWWQVEKCFVQGGALLNGTGNNLNRWRIQRNDIFPINSTDPMIYMEWGHGSMIRDNNLEGTTTGIHLKNQIGCRMDGNAGEKTDPFTLLEECWGCLITDTGISNAQLGGTNRVYVHLITGGSNNMIVAACGQGGDGMYNHANWIDDDVPLLENWKLAPSRNATMEQLVMSGELTWPS